MTIRNLREVGVDWCAYWWCASFPFLAATWVSVWLGSVALAEPIQEEDLLFYKPLEYGSESQFNPVSSFARYSLDSLQISESFDDDHFASHTRTVWKDLTGPLGAINRAGGIQHFVNSQIFPIDYSHLD